MLTHGIMALPLLPGTVIPPEAVLGAGYVRGVPRLSVPALRETDASLGVSWVGGARGSEGATALPSALSMASSWDPALLRLGGATIGAEAKAKGFNVLLAGGANLIRDPRNGRAFEYLSEDPLLTGILAGSAIAGVQSNNIISTVKHFALNAQETGRAEIDSRISDAAARESDLLAFEIAIEQGQPGSVMCAYNRVNGDHACDSDYLLNRVLKHDWRYKGFVMSDWGAVPRLDAALHGLDQQSGEQFDPALFFDASLRAAATKNADYQARLRDMNRRILYSIYANGLSATPLAVRPIEREAGLAVAQRAAESGIVLLRNVHDALPLSASARKIAVIGGYADTGVLSGGGSSQVQMDGGPAVSLSAGGSGLFAGVLSESYQRSVPLDAIVAKAKGARVTFNRGFYVSDAVRAARDADVVIVFATGWRTEGEDVPDLSLPRGQDQLIDAVARANPNTIVVLESGGPVLMPWLDRTAAVLEAWYPGSRGAEAIASVLFGETNPSGRLPITFPASLGDLPRPRLDGDTLPPGFLGKLPVGMTLSVDYDIEGADVGYRWNARKGHKALFPFGFGLSYTSFTYSGLMVGSLAGRVTIANVGHRAGADVAQLYLVRRPDGAHQRLVGFERVELAAGQSREVSFKIDPRLLADWNGNGWTLRAGTYTFGTGRDAEHLSAPVSVKMAARTWRD